MAVHLYLTEKPLLFEGAVWVSGLQQKTEHIKKEVWNDGRSCSRNGVSMSVGSGHNVCAIHLYEYNWMLLDTQLWMSQSLCNMYETAAANQLIQKQPQCSACASLKSCLYYVDKNQNQSVIMFPSEHICRLKYTNVLFRDRVEYSG